MWTKIPPFLRNKYFLAFLVVFVWLLFFDSHNLIRHWHTRREIRDLRRQQEFYLQEIRRDSIAVDRLESDPEALERYAREKYMMKKEGEDIYIIIEDPR